MNTKLAQIANELRAESLRMVYQAGAGHVAGPLSSADLITALYFGGIVKHNPQNPWDEERDRVILSCGHYCPILYAALAKAGYFGPELLAKYAEIGGLPGHPEYRSHPGVEATTGSLGQGVSQAVGKAMTLKLRHGENSPQVFCIISDGELQEGQVWEAFNTAVKRKLDNLIFVLDRNGIQIEHYTEEVVAGKETSKLEGFGLHVLEVEGNDIEEVVARLGQAKAVTSGPIVVVAHTTAGKGVSFMEGKYKWHDKVPIKQELEQALAELGIMNNEQ